MSPCDSEESHFKSNLCSFRRGIVRNSDVSARRELSLVLCTVVASATWTFASVRHSPLS